MTLKIFSKDSTKSQSPVIVLIILLVILMTSGFSYVGWNSTYAGWVSNIIFSWIFVYYFSIKCTDNANFKSIILFLAFLPFLSSVNAYLRYGQNFYDSYLVTQNNFIWLFYFFFHKWEVKEATLLRAFLLLSFFIFIVQVYQNLFPDDAVFGIMKTTDMNDSPDTFFEERNGILRFRVFIAGFFSMPILLAFLCFIKKELMDLKMLVIVVMMLISVYMSLTRQVIAACLLVLIMSFFIEKKHRIMDYVIMLLMVTGLYYSYDVLFAELSRTTMEEASNENIRVIAYNYFYERDTEDIFAWLIGHGTPKCVNFMHEMSIVKEMHIFSNDVGFIGKWFYVGLPFIFICYYFLYLLFWKYKKYTPTYIRLFAIYGTVVSVMIFPMEKPVYYFVWAIMAYITDLHINNSPLALESTKSKRID